MNPEDTTPRRNPADAQAVRENAKKAIAAVAEHLREPVKAIEASIATTRNHYGKYMGVLTELGSTSQERHVLALALIEAGANEQGVNDALRLVA